MGSSETFPSMRGRELGRVLTAKPLAAHWEYGNGGSHRWLVAPNGRRARWCFHDNREVAPGMTRSMLVNTFGLTVEEALNAVKGRS